MKTKDVAKLLTSVIILALPLLFGCAKLGFTKKDKEGAERTLERYWQALFEGEVRKAYSMFTRESKRQTTLEEFADRVAFGLEKTPLKDSFWTEYSLICKLDIGPVKIQADTAYADVLITMPNLAKLTKSLDKKADSLAIEKMAREDWMMKERINALTQHRYMPLIMHLELKLYWQGFGWRLVYE